MSVIRISLILFLLTVRCTAFANEYASVKKPLEACVACHGRHGALPTRPQYPILAGQHLYYIYVQLKDFKAGLREDAIMGPIAAMLAKTEMLTIAKYFSKQTWPNIGHRSNDQDVKVGLTVVNAGQCVACHLGGFEGNSRVPRLAGQNPAYLEKTMLDFKHKKRNNAPAKGSLMRSFTEEQLKSVAEYLSGL